MKNFSSLSTVGKLLKINFWLYFIISFSLGYFINQHKIIHPNFTDKYYCLSFLLMVYILYNAIAEIIFIKILQKDTTIYISIANNPLIKVFFIQILVSIIGGLLIFYKFELSNCFSYITFSVLVAFFIGSIFESFRYLVRSR